MTKVVGKITRKPRHLYYVDGKGNVNEKPLAIGRKKTATTKKKTGLGKVTPPKKKAVTAKPKTKRIKVSKKQAMTSCGTRLKKGYAFGKGGQAYQIVTVKK